jgi:hypothetical protein
MTEPRVESGKGKMETGNWSDPATQIERGLFWVPTPGVFAKEFGSF